MNTDEFFSEPRYGSHRAGGSLHTGAEIADGLLDCAGCSSIREPTCFVPPGGAAFPSADGDDCFAFARPTHLCPTSLPFEESSSFTAVVADMADACECCRASELISLDETQRIVDQNFFCSTDVPPPSDFGHVARNHDDFSSFFGAKNDD